MSIALPRYRVLIADPEHPEDPAHAAEHDVTILHGDQLRAELEQPRNGLPGMDVAPMHGITLWIWAALLRTHVLPLGTDVQEFLVRMLGFEDLGEDNGAFPGAPATAADPTQRVAGYASPSPSPSTGPAPSTAGSETTPPPSTPTAS